MSDKIKTPIVRKRKFKEIDEEVAFRLQELRDFHHNETADFFEHYVGSLLSRIDNMHDELGKWYKVVV